MSINIQSLNEKELDFYNFSIKHYNLFLVKTLKEISKIYGCGMSFIYNYFSKINVTGLKNYLYELFSMKNSETALYKELSQLKIQQKFVDSLLTDFEQQTAQFKTLDQQEAKLQKIKTLLYEAEIIYGLAFGHSKLAIKDFLGFYNFINNNVNFLDYDRNSDILHSIPEKSLVIIYSIRFVNKKYSKIITDLKKIKSIKLVLVTSNKNVQNDIFDVVFFVNNPMKYKDFYKIDYYIGPLNTFLTFNNYLKSSIFSDNKDYLCRNKKFVKETAGWIDYREAVDI